MYRVQWCVALGGLTIHTYVFALRLLAVRSLSKIAARRGRMIERVLRANDLVPNPPQCSCTRRSTNRVVIDQNCCSAVIDWISNRDIVMMSAIFELLQHFLRHTTRSSDWAWRSDFNTTLSEHSLTYFLNVFSSYNIIQRESVAFFQSTK